MKIRNGFVSNSSSSSFIIGYKGEFHNVVPKALEQMLKDFMAKQDACTDRLKAQMTNIRMSMEQGQKNQQASIQDLERKKFAVLCEKFRNDAASIKDFEDRLNYAVVESWNTMFESTNIIFLKDKEDIKDLYTYNPVWAKSL